MNIRLVRVNRRLPEYKKIKNLYLTAFPSEERAPFFLLMAKSHKKSVDFLAAYHNKKWIGLIYVVSYAELSYVFYFAVTESERGKGYGSGILSAVKKKYSGRRLFLAIERLDKRAPNYSERVKRKQFYLRSGFEDLHCRLREGNVIYDILGIGGKVSASGYKRLMETYMGKILSKVFTMEIVDSKTK